MEKKVQGYYTVEKNGVHLLRYTGIQKEMKLPEQWNGKPLKKIGKGAFATKAQYQEALPEEQEWLFMDEAEFEQTFGTTPTWEKLGEGSSIERLTLPNSVTEIEVGAFANCLQLEQVRLPEGLERLSDYIFSGCKMLSDIILPNALQVISNYAFHDCRQLRELSIPKGTYAIENYAFYNCRRLEKITIPGKVAILGLGAFKNCESLKEIILDGNTYMQSIVADISHEFSLELRNDKERVRLFFPDEACEYIEDYPARQFHQVNYGSGHLYRQCISNSGIDYRRYDQLFSVAVREETFRTALCIAMNRLCYPHMLTQDGRDRYFQFMKEKAVEATKIYMQENNMRQVEKMAELGIYTSETLHQVTDEASRRKKVEFVSFFMDYEHKSMGKIEKSFDL